MLEQNDHFTTWQWYRLRSYRRASFLLWEQLVRDEGQCPSDGEDWPSGALRVQHRTTANNNDGTV